MASNMERHGSVKTTEFGDHRVGAVQSICDHEQAKVSRKKEREPAIRGEQYGTSW